MTRQAGTVDDRSLLVVAHETVTIPEVVDAFISYTQDDRRTAQLLADGLVQSGLEVWWDQRLNSAGAFDSQIRAVLEVARSVVAILSPTALRSPWVRWEITQAVEGGLLVIPVLVDGARSGDLPEALHGLAPIIVPGTDEQQDIRDVVLPGIRRILQTHTDNDDGTAARSSTRRAEARRRLASAAADVAREADAIKRRRSRIDLKQNDTASVSQASASDVVNAPCDISAGMTDLLRTLDVTIAFTSSQTGCIYFLGRNPGGGAVLSQQRFRRPTGLCRAGEGLVLGTFSHVYRLENVVRSGDWSDGVFSHCYIPRTGHYTGLLDIHDVAASESSIVFANTAYNCIAALSPVHSFRVIWKPWWISEIVSEDRCHLNGLAMDGDRPAFATVLGLSDTADGWRDGLGEHGTVVDVQNDAVVCSGLAIPHSPRMHAGRLWLLESATGRLGFLRLNAGRRSEFTPVAQCPGFVRGLDIHGDFAFVGVSRPRHEGFLSRRLERRLADAGLEAWTGVVVVDTNSGNVVEWIRFDETVQEIYDVAVLPGVHSAMALGFVSHDAPGPVTFDRFENDAVDRGSG